MVWNHLTTPQNIQCAEKGALTALKLNSGRKGRTYSKITVPTKQLHSIMTEHFIQVSPEMLEKAPKIVPRPFKKPRHSNTEIHVSQEIYA